MKRLFCALLVLSALPAWAGSVGLDIGSGGKLTFKGKNAPVWGGGSIVDVGMGTGSIPAQGHFSFETGRFLGTAGKTWMFGSGGRISFSGCLDVNGDGDSAKHCDKKDFIGSLFTGSFKNAKIVQIGNTNTFTLSGQLFLTPTKGLVSEFGVSAAPFLAHISLKFTDVCVPSSPASCRASVVSGKLSSVVPEPTAFLLLAVGMLLAGLGHSTLSFFRAHA